MIYLSPQLDLSILRFIYQSDVVSRLKINDAVNGFYRVYFKKPVKVLLALIFYTTIPTFFMEFCVYIYFFFFEFGVCIKNNF